MEDSARDADAVVIFIVRIDRCKNELGGFEEGWQAKKIVGFGSVLVEMSTVACLQFIPPCSYRRSAHDLGIIPG